MALIARLAKETNQGAARAEANPVAGVQGGGLRHDAIVDERAVPAAVAQQIRAARQDNLTVASRDGRIMLAWEDKIAAWIASQSEHRTGQQVILAPIMQTSRTTIGQRIGGAAARQGSRVEMAARQLAPMLTQCQLEGGAGHGVLVENVKAGRIN